MLGWLVLFVPCFRGAFPEEEPRAAAGHRSGIHRAPGALIVCGGRQGFCWLLGLRAFAERSERSRHGGGGGGFVLVLT